MNKNIFFHEKKLLKATKRIRKTLLHEDKKSRQLL